MVTEVLEMLPLEQVPVVQDGFLTGKIPRGEGVVQEDLLFPYLQEGMVQTHLGQMGMEVTEEAVVQFVVVEGVVVTLEEEQAKVLPAVPEEGVEVHITQAQINQTAKGYKAETEK